MRLLIVAAALLLPACGSETVADTAQADAPSGLNANEAPDSVAEKPSVRLPGSEYDLRKPLLDLAHLEDDGLPFERREDGFTGGEAVSGQYEKGILNFFTMPDGGLWKVQLRSGYGVKCGTALSSPDAVEGFVRLVAPSVDAAAIAPQLLAALRNKAIEQVHVGSLRFTAAGNCVQSLDVTELDALPAEKRAS